MSKGAKEMQKVDANNFQKSVMDLLDEYGDEVGQVMEEAIEETAKDAKQELSTAGDFKGKKYRKNWDYKIKSSIFTYTAQIYNKRHYQLTHLLEFGHVKQNGGRTRAFPHVAPVNDKAQREIVQNIEKRLKK